MNSSKKAFEAYMAKQRVDRNEWWTYWIIWKAAVLWKKKNP